MQRLQTIIATLAATLGLFTAVACGGKKGPASCPPGNVVKDGACIAVVTPGTIAAVAQQQSRIDELVKLLDRVDTVGAPIELFNGLRQLEPWQTLKAKITKLEAVDAIAGELDRAVKTLRTFKGSLGEASARLGNLKGELDKLMTDTGAARKIEDVRAQISTQLRGTIEPLASQVKDAIQNAISPLTTQLSKVSGLVIAGCAMADVSGGGDKMKELCTQVGDGFTKARTYVDELKSKPAQLFTEVTTQLTTQLDQLVDDETRKLVTTAQATVNEAIKLPPAAPDAGSAH